MAKAAESAVSCACAVPAGERKTAVVDVKLKESNLTRLKRIEGQVRGLQRMIEEDRYCADVLTQIAAVNEALRGVGRSLMRHHLKHCATKAIKSGGLQGEEMYDELIDLMYKSAR